MSAPGPEALRAIRAWVRLERCFDAFNADLRRRYGVTGAQLAMLRIVADQRPVTLRSLRSQLALHPATIGQLVDRVVERGLLTRRPGRGDARQRELNLSRTGDRLLSRAPIAGPVRLRAVQVEPARLARLAAAFEDAVVLFGLQEWAL